MHWTEPVKVISANKPGGALDNHSIYLASLVKTNEGYRVYYGAMSNRKEWHIYLSQGKHRSTHRIRYHRSKGGRIMSLPDMDTLQTRLAQLQQALRARKIPVILLFEGFGAAGKGTLISHLMVNLDPRGFKVHSMQEPTQDQRYYPMMHRYWQRLPARGQLAIFDRSWYREVTLAPLEEKLKKRQLQQRYRIIQDFESMLAADGTVVLKFFLDITKKEQKARFKALEADKDTRWRVTKSDWSHYEHYEQLRGYFDEAIAQTDKPYAPWHRIDAHDKRRALQQVYAYVLDALESALEGRAPGAAPELAPLPTLPVLPLSQVDLSVSQEPNDYRGQLKAAQERLSQLHNRLYLTRTPLILAFEGWDAAGKGGAIKRIARALDPRGYEVVPIAAPTPLEKSHQHLWRFWTALPKDGHVTIFDRTWYGRVMVERIEGFCSEEEWRRAYEEINHFEQELTERGAILLKFWLHISPEEQLRRFHERQNTPEKQWKITDEDWRNREKWPAYEQAVDEMLLRTHRAQAPWIVVEAENKKFARLKVLHSVINAVEEALK